jgi:hypothetical protein
MANSTAVLAEKQRDKAPRDDAMLGEIVCIGYGNMNQEQIKKLGIYPGDIGITKINDNGIVQFVEGLSERVDGECDIARAVATKLRAMIAPEIIGAAEAAVKELEVRLATAQAHLAEVIRLAEEAKKEDAEKE